MTMVDVRDSGESIPDQHGVGAGTNAEQARRGTGEQAVIGSGTPTRTTAREDFAAKDSAGNVWSFGTYPLTLS